MKGTYKSIALVTLLIAVNATSYAADKEVVLSGPYLGQTPPGLTAEPFAPGIISKAG